MKASKYFEMNDQELNEQLKELKSELFNLRFQMATGQLQNPVSIRETRRNIAVSRPSCGSARSRRRPKTPLGKGETSTMSEVRGNRKTRVGTVVSDKMDKTIVVAIPHPR